MVHAARLEGHETINFGGQEVKVQGHMRPKTDLEAWRRCHSRSSSFNIFSGGGVGLSFIFINTPIGYERRYSLNIKLSLKNWGPGSHLGAVRACPRGGVFRACAPGRNVELLVVKN